MQVGNVPIQARGQVGDDQFNGRLCGSHLLFDRTGDGCAVVEQGDRCFEGCCTSSQRGDVITVACDLLLQVGNVPIQSRGQVGDDQLNGRLGGSHLFFDRTGDGCAVVEQGDRCFEGCCTSSQRGDVITVACDLLLQVGNVPIQSRGQVGDDQLNGRLGGSHLFFDRTGDRGAVVEQRDGRFQGRCAPSQRCDVIAVGGDLLLQVGNVPDQLHKRCRYCGFNRQVQARGVAGNSLRCRVGHAQRCLKCGDFHPSCTTQGGQCPRKGVELIIQRLDGPQVAQAQSACQLCAQSVDGVCNEKVIAQAHLRFGQEAGDLVRHVGRTRQQQDRGAENRVRGHNGRAQALDRRFGATGFVHTRCRRQQLAVVVGRQVCSTRVGDHSHGCCARHQVIHQTQRVLDLVVGHSNLLGRHALRQGVGASRCEFTHSGFCEHVHVDIDLLAVVDESHGPQGDGEVLWRASGLVPVVRGSAVFIRHNNKHRAGIRHLQRQLE